MIHQAVRVVLVLRVVNGGTETEQTRARFYRALNIVPKLLLLHFPFHLDAVLVRVIVLGAVTVEYRTVVVRNHFLSEFV
jgi:ABC-type histidine transport system ATPase subunit